MAETDSKRTSPDEQKPLHSTAPTRTEKGGGKLTPAGESTDPAVHQLLAELDGLRQHQATRDAARKAADAQDANEKKLIEEKLARLKELGYSAG